LRYRIPNPTPATGDVFGEALAANDTDILVGALGDGDPFIPNVPSPGAAYLFDGATGTLRHTFYGPSPLALNFGAAVGFVGPDPLIGTLNDSTRAPGEGAAYLFDAVTGALRQTLRRPSPQAGAGFSSRVGSIGGRPVIASVFDDLVRTHAGAIYLFDETGSATGAFPNPYPDNVDPVGSGQVSLDAIDDRLLAAGFSHHSDGSTPGGDSVYVIDTQTGDVLQTLVGPPPFGTELDPTYVVATGGRIVVSSFGQLFVFDPEGNRYLANGEECDDGNSVDGDGCSARGKLEPGNCSLTPRSDCHPAVHAAANRLTIKDSSNDTRDTLDWRVTSTGARSELGDPGATTTLHLCVYDGSGRSGPRRVLGLPAGCTGDGCWRARRTGFVYRSRGRLPDGITMATARADASGGVELHVHGRGVNLRPPGVPLTLPLQVQLVTGTGSCWTSTFSAASANGGGVFQASAD
jgi:cysteine-rich repeat protein